MILLHLHFYQTKLQYLNNHRHGAQYPTNCNILNFQNFKIMKTLLIYQRLIIQAYTSKEISQMLLNLYIALAENHMQDIKSIIERFEITYEEIQQIQTLTNKLLTSE